MLAGSASRRRQIEFMDAVDTRRADSSEPRVATPGRAEDNRGNMSSPSQPDRAPASDPGRQSSQDALRRLPAVEELLSTPRLAGLATRIGRGALLAHVRAELETWREELKAGRRSAPDLESELASGA